MDANGTRYHLIQGWPDWRRFTVNAVDGPAVTQRCEPDGEDTDVVWDCASSSVTLRPEVFRFLTAPGDRPPSLDDRRGAGCDPYGNWYWIAGNGGAYGHEIRVQSSGSGTSTHYWAAEDELERQHPVRYGDFGPAEEPAPVRPLSLAGLAVTQDAYLVVGVTASKGASSGLLVFDLLTGGPPGGRRLPPNGTPYLPDELPSPPDWISFPAEFEFTPFDMAPRPGGGVFVLDKDHGRVWLFDRTMNLETANQMLRTLEDGATDDFAPVSGSAAPRRPVTIPSGISVDAAVVLGLTEPVAIEALPDDSFFVLDRDPAATDSLIYHFVKGQAVGAPLSTGVMRGHIAGDLSARLLVGHDIAFAPVNPGSWTASSDGLVLRGTLAVASGEGNQVFEFDVYERMAAGIQTGDASEVGALTYEPLPVYLPMRLFGGKAIVGMGDKIYYNFDGAAGDPTGERWLPLIQQHRPRFIVRATLFSPAPAFSGGGEPSFANGAQGTLDGKEPDCVWHRLFIDGCIPPGTSVRVKSRAANDPQALALAAWQDEPGFYRRPEGSELPYATLEVGFDTFELLFQAAKGQYLQLALTLEGTGQATPRLRSLRAYYGRFSYLVHYMPGIYRDQVAAFGDSGNGGANDGVDRAALTFLDRFLALFEGVFTNIEDKIAAAQALLDPRSAPPGALDWLASWFGVAFDPQWDEVRRRLFIRYAMTFFGQRGTLNGLLMALQLGFGKCVNDALFTRPLVEQEAVSAVRIVEQFRTRQTPAVVLGDPTESEGLRMVTVDPSVRWQPEQGASQLQDRYSTYRQENGLTGVLPSRFRPIRPAGPAEGGSAWEAFCVEVLGFVPAFDDAFALHSSQTELQLWQDFLARRYGSIETLNNRYGLTGLSPATRRFGAFAGIPLLDELPADGAQLFDWYAFYSVVPAMHRAAHHFVVLLPAPGGGDLTQEVASQTDLARRIVALEKPAHTTFAIRFYWAMFRLGEARLAIDTLIDLGGRSPQFMQPLVLGQGYLAEGFLTAALHDDKMYARRRSIP
jgi:phage tail-like protein